MINIDVQGYELEVFKGAIQIAKAMISNKPLFKALVKGSKDPEQVTTTIIGHSLDMVNKIKEELND